MGNLHHQIKSGKRGTGVIHSDYITGRGRNSKREDVLFAGYGNMPKWAEQDHRLFWRIGDRCERSNGAVYREHVIGLPNEFTTEQTQELVEDLIQGLVGDRPYEFAVHAPVSSLQGVPNSHLHLMYSDRIPDGIERPAEQTFMRYNSQNPEKGGCRKSSGGRNRMALRDEVIAMRKMSADIQNKVLEKHDYGKRVDHRTLKERGINREPEIHLGYASIKNMSAYDKKQFVDSRRSD